MSNLKQDVEEWAITVIQMWLNRMEQLQISPSDPITTERFYHFVNVNANGDPVKVTFAFDFYLKFLNWGVGRGVNLENRERMILAGLTTRRAKPWFDDVFYKRLTFLGKMLADRYAMIGINIVKNAWDNADKWEKRWETVDSEGIQPRNYLPGKSVKNDAVAQYKKIRMK